MYDSPRVPRDRRRRSTTDEKIAKAAAGTGCLIFLVWLAFWATVGYVVLHFVLKYW